MIQNVSNAHVLWLHCALSLADECHHTCRLRSILHFFVASDDVLCYPRSWQSFGQLRASTVYLLAPTTCSCSGSRVWLFRFPAWSASQLRPGNTPSRTPRGFRSKLLMFGEARGVISHACVVRLAVASWQHSHLDPQEFSQALETGQSIGNVTG